MVRAAKLPAAGAVRGPLPASQRPQLCSLVQQAPVGEEWFSEVKFDGYRFLAWKDGKTVRLVTRNGHDWADRLPAVTRSISRMTPRQAVLDGELVAVRPDGVTSFPALQAALSDGADGKLIFYAFDLLALDGWDLRGCTVMERKRLLRGLDPWTGQLRYSDHQQGNSVAMHREACRVGLEGIICKRDVPYIAGRGGSWVKVKCLGREEFVVLGWTPPARSRTGIGALHVGYYDPEGSLHYAGGVGTGYSNKVLAEWRARLEPLAASPPDKMLYAGDPLDRQIVWVRPEEVIEASYTAWSGAGRVRHPAYLGRREDKAARDVVREVADPEVPRITFKPRANRPIGEAAKPSGWHGAVPPRRR